MTTDLASPIKLRELISLAEETSSERRRELMRGVTDLFFAGDGHGSTEMGLFDDVLTQLAGEMEATVRGELAQRMADAEAPPRGLIRKLARDESIEVARPVLQGSRALTDDDLLAVAHIRGQDHLRAISQRVTVSETVSEAIVERGDDTTVGVLLRNDGAQLSRETQEAVVDRAGDNPHQHEAGVNPPSQPVDQLNEM
jgi:uncharacterized protein (DUF2336 family)